MSPLSLPVAMAAAVTAYVGIYHLSLHLRRPSRSDLYFALTCACMLVYDVAAAFQYSSTTFESAGLWQRVGTAAILILELPFVLLVNEQSKVTTPRAILGALSILPLAGLLTLIERSGWILAQHPLVQPVDTPWGNYTMLAFRQGPGLHVLAVSVPLLLLYCTWLGLGQPNYVGGRLVKSRPASTPLTVAAIALMLALTHDIFVAEGSLHHIFVLEYAWFGVMITMSWTLSHEVLNAALTRSELQMSQMRESATLSAIQDAVITTDLRGNITHLNPAAQRLLATSLESARDQPLSSYVELKASDTNAAITDPVQFAVGRAPNPYGNLPQLVTTDGSERRVDIGGAPLKDGTGHVKGAIIVLRDLTVQHRALGSLDHAKKMEAMGQLAGGAAHDLNNLLTPIMSYVELAQRQVPGDSRAASYLGHVQEAAQRAASLTRHLLALSRKQVLDVHVVSLSEFVKQTVPMVQRLVGDDIRVKSVLDERACRVRIDLGQFEQVLLNLASNARDAMKPGGEITIHVRSLGPSQCCLEVSDTGAGMTPDISAHIFEPFFTTKGRGHGTGLGLASVRGIVEQHGGSIFVDSEPDRGSSFEIVIPTTDAASPTSSVRSVPASEWASGTGQVLVVEDEPVVRTLVKEALTELGYTVFTADGLKSALAIAHAQVLDLLVSDVDLPGTTGPQIRDEVLKLQVVPCLFMTGHAHDRLGERGFVPRGTEVLQKPFTAAELSRRVRQVLHSHRNTRKAAP